MTIYIGTSLEVLSMYIRNNGFRASNSREKKINRL